MSRLVPAHRTSSAPRLALLAVGTALALTACAPNNRVVTTDDSFDVRKSHPIVLAEGDRSIDIFVDRHERAHFIEDAEKLTVRGLQTRSYGAHSAA